jgi:hypothetical protein
MKESGAAAEAVAAAEELRDIARAFQPVGYRSRRTPTRTFVKQ